MISLKAGGRASGGRQLQRCCDRDEERVATWQWVQDLKDPKNPWRQGYLCSPGALSHVRLAALL